MPPLMLTTWSFGPIGNDKAWPALAAGGSALDAAVEAATAIEDDPSVDSVGVGGLPDVDGEVSLDGAVMVDPHLAGAVCYIRRFANPVQIARRVMEKTIHILLAGEGAEEFAEREGFEERSLLTDESRDVWKKWTKDPRNIDRDKYKGWLPPLNVEELRGLEAQGKPDPRSHDTVGVLAVDAQGRLASVCSTSGMAFKTPGRVGDSPIIGQGLYCDQEAGAVAATGTGEIIAGVCGSFLVTELMRAGATPSEAIRSTLERIRKRYTLREEHQVAFIAISKGGASWASGALRPGFRHTVTDQRGTRVEDPTFVLIP